MGNLNHLASRIFGVPLLIEPGKLEVILSAIGPRLGIAQEDAADQKVYGPGDTGKSRKSYFVTSDKIAIIDVVGPLVKRQSGSFMSGGPTTYAEIENEFMDAVTDSEVQGILLQVDSPGGESVGCFELSDLIHSQRGSKPIHAVADGDAFSAAYALASAADSLTVAKSGGVGSVGVWWAHADQSALDAKVGVKVTYIFAGARKIDGNPHEPLSDEAHDKFKALVDRTYGMFIDTVARNRRMDAKKIRKTEADLYFGEQGVEIGFADQVGTFNDALAGLRAAIARPSKSSSAAVSAAPMQQKRGAHMAEKKKADSEEPEPEPVEDPKPKPEPETKPEEHKPKEKPAEAAVEAMRVGMLAYGRDVADLCLKAGLPGMIPTLIFSGKSLDQVGADLQAARVAQDADTQIHSAVLSETGALAPRSGAVARDPKDSPLIQAAEREAERYAKARKEK